MLGLESIHVSKGATDWSILPVSFRIIFHSYDVYRQAVLIQ